MKQGLLDEAKDIFVSMKQIENFDLRYHQFPKEVSRVALPKINDLMSKISFYENPKTLDDLLSSELYKRLESNKRYLDKKINDESDDFESVKTQFAIPEDDLAYLESWLKDNKEKVPEAINLVYISDTKLDRTDLSPLFDIPEIKEKANIAAKETITRYHSALSKMIEDYIPTDNQLSKIKVYRTMTNRSYFMLNFNLLAISIMNILSMGDDTNIIINHGTLIKQYGHEVMGHALNSILTKMSDLPDFVKDGLDGIIKSTGESVAQHFEKTIFETLQESPETQKELGIDSIYDSIYKINTSLSFVDEYQLKLMQYEIAIIAENPNENKSSEGIKKKLSRILDISIDPKLSRLRVDNMRHNIDFDGNLNPVFMSELKYAAKPVDRAIREFEKRGLYYSDPNDRKIIDRTLLTGYWTPSGLVANAKLTAEKYSKDN